MTAMTRHVLTRRALVKGATAMAALAPAATRAPRRRNRAWGAIAGCARPA
jgi:hypothetical protein